MRHTSYLAHEQLLASGRKETLKQKVYMFIYTHRHTTQREITETFGESCRKRVSELVADGSVWETGTKTIDNRKYITYATSNVIQTGLFNA